MSSIHAFTPAPRSAGELERALDIVRHHVASTESGSVVSLQTLVDAFEREALEDALQRTRGNRARAARLLMTTERIFNYRVRRLGIDWKQFKPALG
jgi:transcriptional regulator with GAF, ATPase, and Fis domain